MGFLIPIFAVVSNLSSSVRETGLTATPDLFSSGVRMVSALAITLGLLLFTFYLLRRFFSKKGGVIGSRGLVRVISTTHLGNRGSLVLADVAGEKLLLGLSAQTITLLAKIDRQETLEKIAAVEKDTQPGKSFLWYLEAFRSKHGGRREGSGV